MQIKCPANRVKGGKKEFRKVKLSTTGLTRGQDEKQERKSSILLVGLALQPNSAPPLPLSKSGHTAYRHKKTTYPELPALGQIKVPVLYKLSTFNRAIRVSLSFPCASLQHTGATKGDCYIVKYTLSNV